MISCSKPRVARTKPTTPFPNYLHDQHCIVYSWGYVIPYIVEGRSPLRQAIFSAIHIVI